MSDICPYHQDMMRTDADCQAELARVGEKAEDNKCDITALFDYLRDINNGQKAIAKQLLSVDLLIERIDAHFADYKKFKGDYEKLEKEVKSFSWFREPMNKAASTIWFWVLVVGVMILFFWHFVPQTLKITVWHWALGLDK